MDSMEDGWALQIRLPDEQGENTCRSSTTCTAAVALQFPRSVLHINIVVCRLSRRALAEFAERWVQANTTLSCVRVLLFYILQWWRWRRHVMANGKHLACLLCSANNWTSARNHTNIEVTLSTSTKRRLRAPMQINAMVFVHLHTFVYT